jgi:pimeloyl-ACP methyl ester carboxylesterase
MKILLIPGFWLDADSWGDIPDALRAAGHDVTAITLPGLESDATDAASVRMADQVAAIVDWIDAAGEPVVLVGHSGGGAAAGLAVDRRPERIARAVYVDSWPVAEGGCVNDGFTEVDGLAPLPDWSEFDEEDVRDLDDELREHFRAIARPEPARVATDTAEYTDERRHDVPTTVIATSRPVGEYRRYLDGGAPFFSELAAVKNVAWVDVPTGHWPQLTKPRELAAALVDALRD